jgi:molybdopterin-binding protein
MATSAMVIDELDLEEGDDVAAVFNSTRSRVKS